jgi:opacity protein-like surface antigen
MKIIKILPFFAALSINIPLNAGPIKGGYLGANIGLRIVSNKLEHSNNAGATGKNEKKVPGVAFAIHGGYLRQLDLSKIVMGGEASFMMHPGGFKGSLKYGNNNPEGNFNINHKFTAGASIISGAFVNPKVLMYGKVGYAITKVDMKYTDLLGENPNIDKYNKYLKGVQVGAGLYYTLTPNILVGGEYTYHIVGELEPRKPEQPKNNVKRDFKYNAGIHALTGKISYLF